MSEEPEKFAKVSEVAAYVHRRQSVVVYHHADRTAGGQVAQMQHRMDQLAAATGTEPLGAMLAHRGSLRFFLIVPAPAHRTRLGQLVAAFDSRWTPDVEFCKFDGTHGDPIITTAVTRH
jgi:hypothetical protein